MSEPARQEDLEMLGLTAGAGPTEIARAYRELRDLYSEDSLATYSLFSPEERKGFFERIEEAHTRAGGRPAIASRPPPRPSAPPPPPAVDSSESPGVFFRLCREARGLTLQDVAKETKIGSRHLENIENEDYAQLPVRVYLLGFLVAYAKALRLERPREIADVYLSKFEAEQVEVA